MESNNKKINTSSNNIWTIKKYILYALIFLSGVAALIYELIWIRMLNLTFGVSSFAIATVISVFLLGLGLGSYYFGKKVEKIKNIIRTYAFLELSIGIFSLISFIILKYSSIYDLFLGLFDNIENLYLLSLIRLAISIIILIIPSVLIGGTIPLVVKYLIRENNNLGSKFSKIYYINTLGGVTGILLIGFILIKQIGTWKSFIFAVLLNIIIFIIIILCKQITEQSQLSAMADPSMLESKYQPIKNILPILFITGFVALGFEILWMRVLINFGSGTTLSSTMILGGFLLGFAAGSYYIAKKIDSMKNPLNNLILYIILTGLSGSIIMFLFGKLNIFLADQFGTYARLLIE